MSRDKKLTSIDESMSVEDLQDIGRNFHPKQHVKKVSVTPRTVHRYPANRLDCQELQYSE